jgi:hypothetical protein
MKRFVPIRVPVSLSNNNGKSVNYMQNISAQTGGNASIGSVRNLSVQIGTGTEQITMAVSCQRIETENSAVITETISRKKATPSRKAGKKSVSHSGPINRTGLDRYHKRRAFEMREVPLYMVPAAIRRGIKEKGGKTYRVVVVRTHWNHYNIKIRCSTKKAVGLRSPSQPRDEMPDAFEFAKEKTGDEIKGGAE